jgi:F-type H+-transporting ATPase subunit delta
MKNETLAKIYATSLLDLATEKNELEAVHGDVLYLEKLLEESTLIQSFLESPKIENSERIKVFESTFRGKLSDAVVNFLLVVIRKGRQLFFREMLAEFKVLYGEHIGLVQVTATTAVELEPSVRGKLEEALRKKLAKKVELQNTVNPEILGGIIVRYDGMVADGSLQTSLDKIAANMKAVKFGSEYIHEN